METMKSIFESYSNRQLINVLEHREDYSKSALDICSTILNKRNISQIELKEIAMSLFQDRIIRHFSAGSRMENTLGLTSRFLSKHTMDEMVHDFVSMQDQKIV